MIKRIFKVNDIKLKISLVVSYFLIIGIMSYFKFTCIFIRFLNIPCPGCGMTRAWISMLSFNIADAFQYHLMFWSVPIMFLYFWFDGHIFKNKKIDKIVFWIIAIGFLINWLLNLAKTFIF
jgi:hypothetical protein